MLAYVLLTVIFLCVLNIFLNYNERARMLKKIPGPKDVFIVGNALEIIVNPEELFILGRKYAKIWNGIYRFWAYPMGAVVLYNPADIETVISAMKHSEKSDIYSFLKPWLGDGLLLSCGNKWQQRRKILTPAFHFHILQQFRVTLNENSQRLVSRMKTMTGRPVDLVPMLSEYTLNSICETAMGTKLDDVTSESAKTYKQSIYQIGKLIVERFSRIHFYSDFVFNKTQLKRKQDVIVKTIHEFTETVINERKIYIDKYGSLINRADEVADGFMVGNKKKKTAMLDLLIAAEKDGLIDDSGIQEEVDTFMFEGHDTTASGLTFFLMLLANNKNIQDKIVAELKQELGDRTELSMEDLSKLRYLERCIKESLRLYPPVYFISRVLNEPTQLSGYDVPAGVFCHIVIYDLHRRADLFPDPEKFDPDRFLPENCVGRHPYAYIPFSAGPRNCIGQRFAIMQMKSVASAILREYELSPVTRPEDIRLTSDLVLRNVNPVYVKFNTR